MTYKISKLQIMLIKINLLQEKDNNFGPFVKYN
jgi:hypothetical protein